jgi:hypothetical protein
VKFSQQLNAFTISAQCEYDMGCKVLGHEQEDVLKLCLMLLADGLFSMLGVAVTIHPNGSAQINGKIQFFWRIYMVSTSSIKQVSDLE